MNAQINLRLPENLLTAARSYSEDNGYGSIQEFIKDAVREKLFDSSDISKAELKAIRRLIKATGDKSLFRTEEHFKRKLRR
ncbi:MAG: ribbon-helix-helix domain-containing protein [Nanoarchaeota archaeon]|nr:ribbon-helix-helix domain-containing protein [Nanoarchaeota archaeon]